MSSNWEQFQRAKDILEDDPFYTPVWVEIAPLVSTSEDFKHVMFIIKETSRSNRFEERLWMFGGLITASILTIILGMSIGQESDIGTLFLYFSSLLCILMPGTLVWTFILSNSIELDTCFKVLEHNPTREVYESARDLVKSLKKDLRRRIWNEAVLSLLIWGVPLFFAGVYHLFIGKDKRVDEVWGYGLAVFLTVCIPFTIFHAILREYWIGLYKTIPDKTVFREPEDGISFMVAISPKWEIIELLG